MVYTGNAYRSPVWSFRKVSWCGSSSESVGKLAAETIITFKQVPNWTAFCWWTEVIEWNQNPEVTEIVLSICCRSCTRSYARTQRQRRNGRSRWRVMTGDRNSVVSACRRRFLTALLRSGIAAIQRNACQRNAQADLKQPQPGYWVLDKQDCERKLRRLLQQKMRFLDSSNKASVQEVVSRVLTLAGRQPVRFIQS